MIKIILILIILLSTLIALSDLHLYENIYYKYRKYIILISINSISLLFFINKEAPLFIFFIIALLPILLSQFIIDVYYHILEDKSNLVIVLSAVIMYLVLFFVKELPMEIIFIYIKNSFIILIIYCLLYIISKKTLGIGDIKLITAIALFFPYPFFIKLLIYPYFLAGIYSIVLLIIKKHKINYKISFGPFIIISVLLICILC